MKIKVRNAYDENINSVIYENAVVVDSDNYKTFSIMINNKEVAVFNRENGMCYDIINETISEEITTATEETEAAAVEMPEKENSEEYIEIMLTAQNSNAIPRCFEKYEDFIESWRFWFASGNPYKSDEETFAQMAESLKAFHKDGASLEILLNGLFVKMIFHRWK